MNFSIDIWIFRSCWQIQLLQNYNENSMYVYILYVCMYEYMYVCMNSMFAVWSDAIYEIIEVSC